jgi:chromosome segregation ATPase
MIAGIMTWVESLFGDSGGDHPLDRSKEDHQVKRQEAEQKLDELRTRRDDLKAQLDEKQAAYEEAQDAGDDERAQDHLRDAEEIKNKLETVRGRIDEVSQQRNFAANLINTYEMRASHDDEYWRQLKEMDERTLFRAFSKQEMEIDQMLGMLEKGTETTDEMIGSYRETTEDMHRASDLEAEWNNDTEESRISADDVFESEDLGAVGTDSSEDNLETN